MRETLVQLGQACRLRGGSAAEVRDERVEPTEGFVDLFGSGVTHLGDLSTLMFWKVPLHDTARTLTGPRLHLPKIPLHFSCNLRFGIEVRARVPDFLSKKIPPPDNYTILDPLGFFQEFVEISFLNTTTT